MAPKWLSDCGFGTADSDEKIRTVLVNSGDEHELYMGNYTRTTKYTLITYFPKALFEQYRRVANIYFTLVAALSLTQFSPVRPWTTWTPLIIVLGVSMIKEAREDYVRYKADKEVNNRQVQVLDRDKKHFHHKRWKEVKVGEIIKVKKDEFFAADLLFLTAESEEGTCYVETMNLDGETNLKIKKALDETKDYKHDTLHDFRATIVCEPPNSRLYQFSGNLMLGDEATAAAEDARKIPINPASILLRGCALRNTDVVYGAVIYAGHESKIFKNSTTAPSKRSALEKVVDKIILFMFSILFCMCITGCIYFAFWTADKYPYAWYMQPSVTNIQYNSSEPVVVAITNFITVFILYGYLIPISLYVTVEIVKMVQSMVFIAMDREMYHAETDTPALARTSNLNEELGMVNTVLSDKTGTLTRNVMEFFKCSIAGVSYGAGVTEIDRSNAERRGVILDMTQSPEAIAFRERFFNFYDTRLMNGAWTTANEPATIEMFFRLLAVCHTVIPDGEPTPEGIRYEAESPDEAALVVGAKVMGFFCFKRTNTSVFVRETTAAGTRDVEYEVLNILEFNSTRKRMSVIVKDDQGKIIIFCKGADTVIYERLEHNHPLNVQLKVPTTAHMDEYGSAGLRTLCLSYAEVDPAFYATWQEQYLEAKTSIEGRDEKLAAVSELIEKDLKLLGCTAIEDKLQEGVPQCIRQLAVAGIRLWVLTGDKMETAINIGFACSLLTEEMDQFIVTAYTEELDKLEAEGKVQEAAELGYRTIQDNLAKVDADMAKKNYKGKYAMVIDGKALSFALSDSLSPLFLKVGLCCAAVVCCRVSPLQKAQVTGLVKDHGDITLAIGDGANDVGMIQRAHIGVGISGQEGMQAVMSADFAIAQFRYLTPLLLVHGRWSYKRLARMINFFFYKNLLFGTTIFCFNAFTAFSGQYMYNDFYMTLFNVVFTSLLPIVIGMFDRDVDREMGLRYPALYKQGQRNQYLNLTSILGWLTSSLYQSGIIMTFMLIGCSSTTIGVSSGQPFAMFETGIIMFSIVLITVHMEIMQITEQWTIMHHIAIWLSNAVWYLFLLIFGVFPISLSGDLYYLFVGVVAPNPHMWLYLLLVPLTCQLPDFFWRQMRRHIWPEEHHVLQELYLQERDALLKAKRAGGSKNSEGGGDLEADGSNIVKTVFENGQRKGNTGFVPPYHKNSRFYQLTGSFFGRDKKAGSGPSGGLPPTQYDEGRGRVLQHMDTLTASQRLREQGTPPSHAQPAVEMRVMPTTSISSLLPPNKVVAANASQEAHLPAPNGSHPTNGQRANGSSSGANGSSSGANGDALMTAYMAALK